jgi:LysW-gamma-L-lysine carboxypeptidase
VAVTRGEAVSSTAGHGHNPEALAALTGYRPLYVVKLGSATLRHESVFDEIAELSRRGVRLLLVAGGAADIADYYRAIDRPVRTLQMRDDAEVRYCPPEEITHVIAAYETVTLPRIRRALAERGLAVYAATAQAEALVVGTPNRPVKALEDGRVKIVRDHRAGVVSSVRAERLSALLDTFDVVAVSAPVSADDDGAPLNVDADVLAAEIARGLDADHLRLVTGTAGLLRDFHDPTSTITDAAVGEGMSVAFGRMRQKVRAAELALTGATHTAITGPNTLSTERATRFWRAPAPAPDLELLARMVEISSVSGDEHELARFLARWCRDRGIFAGVDAAGNLFASKGAGERRLLMLGHMDTVPFRWPATWDGDTLTGRGSVDAKGSLAAFLHVLADVEVPDGSCVQVVGTVDEERTAAGAFWVRDHYRSDAVIVGEPSGSGALTIGYHGVCKAALSVAQTSAHTAAHGARTAASRVVDAVTAVESAVRKASPDALFAVLAVEAHPDGVRQTGTAVVDVRVPPGTDVADIVAAITAAVEEPIEVEFLLATPPVLTERTDPLARAFARAIRGATSSAPRMLSKKGSSDMNTLATTWSGVPMVAYGPGDASLDHTPHERLDAAEFRAATAVLRDAVGRWLADPEAAPASSGLILSGASG